jgi:hypothetical protein
MKHKNITYTSKEEKIKYTIFQEPSNDRKRVFFYLTVDDPDRDIVLTNLQTIAIEDDQSIDDPFEVTELINKKSNKTKFRTILTFKYGKTDKPVPHTNMIDYVVPGFKHELLVITPEGQEIFEEQ